MKKIIALLLAAVMAFAFTACTESNQDEKTGNIKSTSETETPAVLSVADDTSVMGLSFVPPEGYKTAERFVRKGVDGSLIEKNLTYDFDDESEVMIGYTSGQKITDTVSQDTLDKAEITEYAGKSFYIIEQGNALAALLQEEDIVYGVAYTFAEEIDREKFDKFMTGISFTDATSTQEDDDTLYDITYSLEKAGSLLSTSTTVTVTPDGETVRKALGWHFGEDKDNPDYRFLIRVYKNSTVEKEVDSDKEYEEKEINGITFTVRKTGDDDKTFEYFTQHGNDVYKIYNNGSSDGWFVTRSEESEVAFESLINSINFK